MQTDTPEKKRNHASFIIILIFRIFVLRRFGVLCIHFEDGIQGWECLVSPFRFPRNSSHQGWPVAILLCKKTFANALSCIHEPGWLTRQRPPIQSSKSEGWSLFPRKYTWFTWSKINIKWCLFPGNTVILDRKLTKKCLLGRWHPSESWSLLRGYSLIFGGGVLSVIYEPWMQLVKEFHLQNVPFFIDDRESKNGLLKLYLFRVF